MEKLALSPRIDTGLNLLTGSERGQKNSQNIATTMWLNLVWRFVSIILYYWSSRIRNWIKTDSYDWMVKYWEVLNRCVVHGSFDWMVKYWVVLNRCAVHDSYDWMVRYWVVLNRCAVHDSYDWMVRYWVVLNRCAVHDSYDWMVRYWVVLNRCAVHGSYDWMVKYWVVVLFMVIDKYINSSNRLTWCQLLIHVI